MFTIIYFDGTTVDHEFEGAVAARRFGRADANVRRITSTVCVGRESHDIAVYNKPGAWDVNRVPDAPAVPVVASEDD